MKMERLVEGLEAAVSALDALLKQARCGMGAEQRAAEKGAGWTPCVIPRREALPLNRAGVYAAAQRMQQMVKDGPDLGSVYADALATVCCAALMWADTQAREV